MEIERDIPALTNEEQAAGEAIARSHGNPVVVRDDGSELIDTDPTFVSGAQEEFKHQEVTFNGLTHSCDNPACHVFGFVKTLTR